MTRFQIGIAIVSGMLAGPTWAQVEVGLRVTPDRAVLHEPIMATVRVVNQTSETIVLRDDTPGQRLWLDIESGPGRTIRPITQAILGTPLEVPPRQSVSRQINITESYDIRVEGPYTVRARLDWNGEAYVSSRAFLDVAPGLEVARLVAAASDAPGDRRLYRLLTLNRDRGDHLFLRIDDQAAQICEAVIHLDRVIRVQPPRMQVDAFHQVHVLHQFGPGRYLHHIFTSSGQMVSRRVFTSEDPGVTLEYGEDGRVMVSGATANLLDER